MRIVVDGRSLGHEGDALASAAHQLLGAWSTLREEDEIHLLISGDPGLCMPDGVVTHQLSTHALTRAAAAWHRCRFLRPDVILGFVPSVDPTAGPRHRRGRIGAHRADATVSISSHLRPDLVGQTAHLHSQPLRVLAAPGAALMALSGSNAAERGRGGPHLLVVDDTVAERLSREQATWSDMAGRLRTALLDTMAMSSWRDRRFKVRPSNAPSTTAIPLPLAPAPAAAGRSRARVHRSARWIGGVSAATLTLSAVSAASVNLVLPVHSPPHSAPAPSVTTPVVTGQVTTPPAVTPTTLAPSTANATSPTAPTVTTTTSAVGLTNPSAGTSTSTTSPTVAPVGGPTLTLPTISLPTIQLPTLPLPPLPTLTCSPTTTTTTSPLQLINPCALPLTGSTLGGL